MINDKLLSTLCLLAAFHLGRPFRMASIVLQIALAAPFPVPPFRRRYAFTTIVTGFKTWRCRNVGKRSAKSIRMVGGIIFFRYIRQRRHGSIPESWNADYQ